MTKHRIVTFQRSGAALTDYAFIDARFEDQQANGWATQMAVPWEMAEAFEETLAVLPRRPVVRPRLTEIPPPDPFYQGVSYFDPSRTAKEFGLLDLTLPAIAAEIDDWQRRDTGA